MRRAYTNQVITDFNSLFGLLDQNNQVSQLRPIRSSESMRKHIMVLETRKTLEAFIFIDITPPGVFNIADTYKIAASRYGESTGGNGNLIQPYIFASSCNMGQDTYGILVINAHQNIRTVALYDKTGPRSDTLRRFFNTPEEVGAFIFKITEHIYETTGLAVERTNEFRILMLRGLGRNFIEAVMNDSSVLDSGNMIICGAFSFDQANNTASTDLALARSEELVANVLQQ